MPYGITQSYLPPAEAASSALTLVVTDRYSIYTPINNERLNRPEPTKVIDLPRVATEVNYYVEVTHMHILLFFRCSTFLLRRSCLCSLFAARRTMSSNDLPLSLNSTDSIISHLNI